MNDSTAGTPSTALTTSSARDDATVDRVARFQSLQSGQYWRAAVAVIEQGIEQGTVLLIQSIRWVDDKPHTVILRPHPSKIGREVKLAIPQDDGSTRTQWFRYDEHRFLIDDFLNQFEYEPDHQPIRNNEVRAVQSRVNALQAELIETQSNPALLASVVDAGLRAHAEKESQSATTPAGTEPTGMPDVSLPALSTGADSGIVSLATGTVANAIGSGITAERIAEMKAAASREHQIATIKANWIQSKTKAIADTITELTPYYEEQAAAALAQTEDVRTYVAKLLQGIESLDLYIGKGVTVDTIREGTPAARDVPLTFVQKKLVMDEELAVWTDIDEWFDFQHEDKFFDALRVHDGLIDQIFPTERCVLVMATTRRFIDYGDARDNVARNEENAKVFLLVRDGMNIHRVLSPVESHLGANRLFPTQSDQDAVFRGLDGSQIKFEDVAFTDKLAKHELFALHYKRFLLLACGLDHRLKLFGHFYEGAPSLDFVSLAFQERHCRFLHDDDASTQLPGGERQTLSDWIDEKNAYLRSGSRVLCNWREVMNPDTAPGACKSNGSTSGRGFDARYTPQDRLTVAIAYRDGKSICVDVEVSGYSYSSHGDRTFNCKVNLSKFRPGAWDYVDLPFLCLDAVDPMDLRWYIQHRGSRSNHLAYIRFFKQALKHIERERDEERDTRNQLMQALVDGNVADPADHDAIIDQTVLAWRAANRGKPLPRFDGDHAPAAWTALLDQMYMLAGEGKRRVAEIESFVLALGYRPLRLVLSGAAKCIVYAAPRADECDDRLEPHAWVHRITVERGKTKYVEKSRRWVALPKHAASETTLHEWSEANEWATRTSVFASFEHKAELFAATESFGAELAQFTRPLTELAHEDLFERWKRLRAAMLDGASSVQNPVLAIPFGIVYNERARAVRFLCIGTALPHAFLHRLAPNDAAQQAVHSAFVRPYARKERAAQEMRKALQVDAPWALFDASISAVKPDHAPFVDYAHELDGQGNSPLLADWFDNWRTRVEKNGSVWVAPGAITADGRLALDPLLGIALPADYEPVRMLEITLTSPSDQHPPQYGRWIDICRGEEAAWDRWQMGDSPEMKRLLASTPKALYSGYSRRTHTAHSPRDAREFIARHVAAEYGARFRAVPATQIAEAPQPPEGIERFFVLDDTAAN
ncbi:hypothetical protein [Burkholderia sp. Tr-20390]|uniref:hypothetical protein n=1 Tax=Burkholderia sp. Tr-20390 TaxID=2703904 RepID=UPI001980BAD7|nr:hypothetical protein [Burkholderia sp. Tr-20390]MBN3729482.1 hypothetical protein [Burkholderia sp. Tr-20390]